MLGIIGRKIGMTQIFHNGNATPVTVIESKGCQIVYKRTLEKDGYTSLGIGFEDIKEKHSTKPMLGMYKAAKVAPKKIIREFRVDNVDSYDVSQSIDLNIFNEVLHVDVSGVSKGKGFQGVMKRHNFSGGPASHGSSLFHRGPGSIGQCTFPAKVFKGMKMAGRMGNSKVTVQNLKVIKVDIEKNLLLVKGAVPGPNKSYLVIKPAIKKRKKTGKVS